MQRHWTDHDLETYWSFSSEEFKLLPQRDASSRLGVAASLKFFQLEGSFPSSGRDIPAVALHYMAQQLDVEPNVGSQKRAAVNVRQDISSLTTST
jgi:Domain of unknown function (DUF4158)